MIDFSSTVVELSGDSEKQKEVQDIAKCLRTLYSTPIGSQEGDRELGINPKILSISHFRWQRDYMWLR